MDGYSVKDAGSRPWHPGTACLGAAGARRAGRCAGRPRRHDRLPPATRRAAFGGAVAGGDAGAASEAPGTRTNGNGGSHELSPFRELLTEFRNLTERYGQALLALGEARGEVAALRGRVELLEARMDLRLPSTPATSTVAWEMSDFAAEEAPARSAFEADAAAAGRRSIP